MKKNAQDALKLGLDRGYKCVGVRKKQLPIIAVSPTEAAIAYVVVLNYRSRNWWRVYVVDTKTGVSNAFKVRHPPIGAIEIKEDK